MIYIKIAGIPMAVDHRYPRVAALCADYLTEEAPLFTVAASDEELQAEREISAGNFSEDILESVCIHRAVVKHMISYGIWLIHSAVVAVDGEAFVFMAKSGVGKSTHLRQWKAYFGDRAVIVNGDKPMFSFQGDRLYVHGTPWKGKEGWGKNLSMPVKALCFLERGKTNSIQKAEQHEIIEKLFHQVLLPDDAAELSVFMSLINRMICELPFYRLQCTIAEEAAMIAYQMMSKGEV